MLRLYFENKTLCSFYSFRLGIFWKNMSKDMKEKYFALAREVDREHKRKYPGTSCPNIFP